LILQLEEWKRVMKAQMKTREEISELIRLQNEKIEEVKREYESLKSELHVIEDRINWHILLLDIE